MKRRWITPKIPPRRADPECKDGNRETLLEKDAKMDGRRTNKECIALIRAQLAKPKVRYGPAHHVNKVVKIGTDVDLNKEIKNVSGLDAVADAPKMDTTDLEQQIEAETAKLEQEATKPRRFSGLAGFLRRSSSSSASEKADAATKKAKKAKKKKKKSAG